VKRRVTGGAVRPPLWHRLLTLAGLGGLAVAACLLWYANGAYDIPEGGITIDIPQGSQRGVARALAEQGVGTVELPFWALGRITGLGNSMKAGRYRIEPGTTPYRLLEQMVRGDTVKVAVTLVEGWRFSQWRAALAAESGLRNDTGQLGEAELMAEIGAPGVQPEGRFMPDTYLVSHGTSDRVVLRMAYRAMQDALAAAWADRSKDAVVRSPDEALVLASIIEKETGVAEERPLIAGVFGNRLRRGMLLQTDPTVIYGLGERFNGNLTKADLTRDTPWNTYTRAGLPPTPIAMPGRAALAAATRPARTDALYFVAAGGGRHTFSRTLEQHNVAVRQLVQRTR
jgi:UPF0755 protein